MAATATDLDRKTQQIAKQQRILQDLHDRPTSQATVQTSFADQVEGVLRVAAPSAKQDFVETLERDRRVAKAGQITTVSSAEFGALLQAPQKTRAPAVENHTTINHKHRGVVRYWC